MSHRLEFPPLLRVMAALVAIGLILAFGLPLLLMAQDSTAAGGGEVPTTLKDFLTSYQLPIATVLASGAMYLMAHVSAFTRLGDWTKRIAYLVAAVAVSAAVKAVGGDLSPDLASWMSAGLGGAVAAGAGMTVFAMGKSQPGHN